MHERNHPLAYLITFTTYGTRLHGSEQGSIDRGRHSRPARRLAPNPGLERYESELMTQPAYGLDRERAAMALAAMQETAGFRNWVLLAAHLGTTHVHLVVSADADSRRVMGDMKSYVSRALARAGYDGHGRKRWTRGGSVGCLRDDSSVARAIRYVLNQPGKTLASYQYRGASSVM